MSEDQHPVTDPIPSLELLELNHTFPGVYQFKVIGNAADGFESRVLDAVRPEVGAPTDLEHSVRSTSGGRHVALTIHVNAGSAEDVRRIYAKIRDLDGVLFLL
jgi:uncharacterized protein